MAQEQVFEVIIRLIAAFIKLCETILALIASA